MVSERKLPQWMIDIHRVNEKLYFEKHKKIAEALRERPKSAYDIAQETGYTLAQTKRMLHDMEGEVGKILVPRKKYAQNYYFLEPICRHVCKDCAATRAAAVPLPVQNPPLHGDGETTLRG